MIVGLFVIVIMVIFWFGERGHRWAQKLLAPIEALAPLGGPGSSSYEEWKADQRHRELMAATQGHMAASQGQPENQGEPEAGPGDQESLF